MAELALTVDLSKRALSDSLADAAPLVLGDKLRVSLAFTRSVEGVDQPADLPIRAIRCSLGKTLAPPDSGEFSLASEKLDSTPVDIEDVDAGITAADFLTALAGLVWVTAVTKPAPGCWVLTSSRTSEEAAPPEFAVTKADFSPTSFVRTRQFLFEGFWCVEIRCIQTPYAFSGTFERVLAAPPAITRIRGGGVVDAIAINEIQQLLIPANFSGLYAINFDLRKTKILGLQDGPEQLAAALNAMYTDGKTRFAVSLPQDFTFHIEGVGQLAGTALALMTVTVVSYNPGAPNFVLDLATAELAAALRAVPQLTAVPFECEADVVEDGLDPEDLDNPARTITLWQDTCTINREQVWAELATIPAIDWQRPPARRSYVPFNANQIAIGTLRSIMMFGDGAARTFTLDHDLGTDAIAAVLVRENVAGGAQLIHGTDYTVTFTDDNSLSLALIGGIATPEEDALVAIITAAEDRAQFLEGVELTVEQITGLGALLTALGTRVSVIEELVPTVPLAAESLDASEVFTIPLAEVKALLPGVWPAAFDYGAAITSGAGLASRGRGLLPALHTDSASAASLPLGDPADFAGTLFYNDESAPIVLPGGLGHRSEIVPVGGFFASDGRVWYAVREDVTPDATTSYFPICFEKELFMVHISDRMLRAGQSLDLTFDLLAATHRANTRAQWLLVVEVGAVTQDTAPTTTGENLAAVTWQNEPILLDRLILSGTPMPSTYGVRIARSAGGDTFTSSALTYGKYEASEVVPAAANFVLRARMIQFDTENSVALARGYARVEFTAAGLQIS